MRGKDFNAGLRGVLFEARHYQRMGAALWLYGWLVLRQTHQQGSIGWVLGGSPISYREIEEETGFNCRTLERWMHTLRRHGYIETESAPLGVIVRITKAKKFPQTGRKLAEGVRRFAGSNTQSCVSNGRKSLWKDQRTAGIGSSSIAGSQENIEPTEFSTDLQSQNQNPEYRNHNPPRESSGLDSNRNSRADHNHQQHYQPTPQSSPQDKSFFNLRMRQQLLRAEREEAVRRELAVGTNPEVRRS